MNHGKTHSVVLHIELDLVVEEPHGYDPDLIEFRHNESSWCANNYISDLAKLLSRLKHFERPESPCMCFGTGITTKFVREATEQDERDQGMDP